jgi:2-polyprenyl-3-methyl-5-hydroxy-6-metoxy-1,4-benzoquinol methylase
VFAPKQFHLNEDDEKLRYDSHKNDPKDQRYRQFLKQVLDPLLVHLKNNSVGLDFGCGPGPTLSVMLEEEGYKVDIYDKFYYNNQAIFNNKYDFITATEVIEHLAKPGEELARLYGMLNVGGVLAVMTNILRDDITFSSWYYKDDPTHICFYSKNTMNYLAKKWNVDVKFYGKNVALFFK